jgi:lactoylglutathione lyase
VRVSYAIVFVSDMRRSVAFYRDVLGVPVRFETPEWTELATDGATLALHLGGPSPAGSTWVTHAGQCQPGLNVPDLDAFHRRMVAHGVPCVQEPKEIAGARIARYRDPDGLEISVGEDRPAGHP